MTTLLHFWTLFERKGDRQTIVGLLRSDNVWNSRDAIRDWIPVVPTSGPLRPYRRSILRRERQQGNRVKESCGDECREEVVVPGGDLATEAH